MLEYPGACYHIINRGNAGENIFNSVRDREKFLEYLEKAVERFSIIVHTYCLMTTHYHLLVETPQPNLSAAIQWLNVSYAAYYNKKRRRSGHLFSPTCGHLFFPHPLCHLAGMKKRRDQYIQVLLCHPWPNSGSRVGDFGAATGGGF